MIDLHNVPDAPISSVTRRDADVLMLRTAMRDTQGPRLRSRWTPRLITASAAAATVLCGSGVAAAVIHHAAESPSVQTSGRCYSEASSNFGPDFPGSSVANASSPTEAAAPVPSTLLGECEALWRVGLLKSGTAAATGIPGQDFAVPPLVACVLPSGEAAVFPGDTTTCASLNLAPLATGTGPN